MSYSNVKVFVSSFSPLNLRGDVIDCSYSLQTHDILISLMDKSLKSLASLLDILHFIVLSAYCENSGHAVT